LPTLCLDAPDIEWRLCIQHCPRGNARCVFLLVSRRCQPFPPQTCVTSASLPCRRVVLLLFCVRPRCKCRPSQKLHLTNSADSQGSFHPEPVAGDQGWVRCVFIHRRSILSKRGLRLDQSRLPISALKAPALAPPFCVAIDIADASRVFPFSP